MALQSPGVEVSVIDDSTPSSSAPSSTPMIFVATAENKTSATQSGVAAGTLRENIGRAYLVTSQRELGELFGDAYFQSDDSNNMVHGGELNEYGLQTAYSVLGVTNRAYVTRADIDLSQLTPSVTPSAGEPESGELWLDTRESEFGLVVWDNSPRSAGGQSYNDVEVIRVALETDVDTADNSPKRSIGGLGSYAIVTYTDANQFWYKSYGRVPGIDQGQWVPVGSDSWKMSIPTVRGTTAASVDSSGSFSINESSIAIEVSDTVDTVVEKINTKFTATGDVQAANVNGVVEIYTSLDQIELSDDSFSLTQLGIDTGTYRSPQVYIGSHTDVPDFRDTTDSPSAPSGSLWLKTTEPNGGINISLKQYSEETGLWQDLNVPAFSTPSEAIYSLDRSAGGSLIPEGTVFAKINSSEIDPPLLNMRLYEYSATGRTESSTINFSTLPGESTFEISETYIGSPSYSEPVTITVDLDGSTDLAGDAEKLAAAINSSGLLNVRASINTVDPTVTVYHETGGEIRITDVTGILMTTIFSGATNAYTAPSGSDYDVVISPWKPLVYTASETAPTSTPADGSLWYTPVVDEVDIMVNDGARWRGYREVFPQTRDTGPFVGATAPSSAVDDDLWVDTGDIDNYPALKRYVGGLGWLTVDLTDQTSDLGILFDDARWSTSGADERPADIIDLLESDYVDPDAPDPALYARGMLLWNTRRSGFNVKRFVRNHIDTTGVNTRVDEPMNTYYPHRWVTESANNEDGSGSFGRLAQRKAVTQSLQALVNSNQDIRDDQARQFTLMACPGYPELIGEMISLNADRGMSAFIVGDTPARLSASATEINDWANNVQGAVEDNDQGAVSFSEYMAMYFGWGFTSDNFGNNVVVPPSHMALRTILINDQIAYPWYAPAGTRRGGVTNATSTGYIDSEGEFRTVTLTQGRRDTLYENSINPITFISGSGLMVYGQKTRARTQQAMDRINVARLVIYIRNQLEQLTSPYIFQPNDAITRNQAKATVDSFLLELVGLRALDDFLVVCSDENNTAARQSRNELWIDIAIAPLRSIEFIYVPLRLQSPDEI